MKQTQIDQWAEEARAAAHLVEHEWDQKNIDWPGITADSVVFEIGSYKGRWALQMCERYAPNIYCFEPQVWACVTTRAVLKDYPKAQVFNYALGIAGGTRAMIEYGTDGAKLVPYRTAINEAVVEIRDIAQVVAALEVPQIDLMLVNIEGYEYTLIPYMFESGIFPRFMSVQFHTGDYIKLRQQIEEKYSVLWDYGKTLAGFVLKDGHP